MILKLCQACEHSHVLRKDGSAQIICGLVSDGDKFWWNREDSLLGTSKALDKIYGGGKGFFGKNLLMNRIQPEEIELCKTFKPPPQCPYVLEHTVTNEPES